MACAVLGMELQAMAVQQAMQAMRSSSSSAWRKLFLHILYSQQHMGHAGHTLDADRTFGTVSANTFLMASDCIITVSQLSSKI